MQTSTRFDFVYEMVERLLDHHPHPDPRRDIIIDLAGNDMPLGIILTNGVASPTLILPELLFEEDEETITVVIAHELGHLHVDITAPQKEHEHQADVNAIAMIQGIGYLASTYKKGFEFGKRLALTYKDSASILAKLEQRIIATEHLTS